jgi:hypothetical protein
VQRHDCGLCEEMLAELNRLGRTRALPPIDLIDVDSDPLLKRRHGLDVPVLLLDVPIASLAERTLLQRLASGSPDLLATVPMGDEPTLAAWKQLGAVELQGEGTVDVSHVLPATDEDAPALARLGRFLFESARPPAGGLDGQVKFFSAPGEGRETIEIARRILEEANQGLRFDQMAILVRSPQTYVGLLEHALDRARIPGWFDQGTRRPDPAGRAFLAILACASERLSAKRFAEYLSLGQVPDLVDGAPKAVKEKITKAEAADIKKKLEEVGGGVEVK